MSVAAITPVKERLFATPTRPGSFAAGGVQQLEQQALIPTTPLAKQENAYLKSQGVDPLTGKKKTTGGVLGVLNSVADGINTVVDAPANLVTGGLSDAGNAVGNAASSAVSSMFSGFLSWLEGNLERGALYGALIIGGAGLAAYGLVKALEPTGAPQALRGGLQAAAVAA